MANKPTILRAAGNNINQALNGAINSSTTTVILDDAGDCNASGGLLEIDYNSPTLREVIYYNSKSTHTLTVADDGRGLYGTTAQSHLDGALVRGFFVDDHINKLVDVVSNIEVSDLAAAAVVTEADTIAANDNDTTIPTSAAVKAYADGTWWEELGRTTLTSTASEIVVASFAERKHLKIKTHLIGDGLGTITGAIQFNSNTGANYSFRNAINGGADTTSVNASSIGSGSSDVGLRYIEMDIMNLSGYEKIVRFWVANSSTAGAGTAPGRYEGSGKWTGTDMITTIKIFTAYTFDVGSQVVVLGHD